MAAAPTEGWQSGSGKTPLRNTHHMVLGFVIQTRALRREGGTEAPKREHPWGRGWMVTLHKTSVHAPAPCI